MGMIFGSSAVASLPNSACRPWMPFTAVLWAGSSAAQSCWIRFSAVDFAAAVVAFW